MIDINLTAEILPYIRLYTHLRAFWSRFLELSLRPKYVAPLVVDYCLLLHSIWSTRSFGPDFVYPTISVTKRPSGRLAKLILEHCRNQFRNTSTNAELSFQQGLDRSCVAVVDLDDVSRDVVDKGYSTQVDLYGLMSLLVLVELTLTLVVHILTVPNTNNKWTGWLGWVYCPLVILVLCLYVIIHGSGTLTLSRRSDIANTARYAMLLDRDLAVILHGKHNVVEAVTEGGFYLSHPNSLWGLGNSERRDAVRFPHVDLLEASCEGTCLMIPVSCWLLLLRPSTTSGALVSMVFLIVIVIFLQGPPRGRFDPLHFIFCFYCRCLPSLFLLVWYGATTIGDPLFEIFDPQRDVHFLTIALLVLFSVGHGTTGHYPIRSAKLFDALGHPPVRIWHFGTPAAAAAFQCLVLCRGIARPVRHTEIDVLGLLDMLVPDQRDVWGAWKNRVADRIMHEVDTTEVEEVLFAPTIPTFGDERQQLLKTLLDQAQGAYDTYCRMMLPEGRS